MLHSHVNQYIASCHVMSYHVMSCHIISQIVTSQLIISHYTITYSDARTLNLTHVPSSADSEVKSAALSVHGESVDQHIREEQRQ
jgi:hypothetical protein